VTEAEIYIVLGLFMLTGIIRKPTLRSYFSTKMVISTPGFGDIITRDGLERICKFLHFADNETINNFQGPKKLFEVVPVISHLNNVFQELYLPNQDILINESLTFWKGCLYFKQSFLSRHHNLELKLKSCVMLPLGTRGHFLYMQARMQNWTPACSQLTLIKQQPLF
jgi:hypothetical protein